jgi:hypothetical protein
MTSDKPQAVLVRIFDGQGRLVQTNRVEVQGGVTSFTVDLAAVQTEIGFVHVCSEAGCLVRKFVKMGK